MKILYVCREFPYPADSGVKQRNWYILERLAQQHEVHLVCYGRPEQAQDPTVRQVCRAVRVVEPLPRPTGPLLYWCILKGLFSTMPYGVAGRFDSGFKHQVAGLLAEGRFDLVFCDSLYHAQHLSGSLARLILNEHNIESVIIRRYAAVETNLLKKAYAWFEGRRMAWYEDRIWRQFDRIWMCSEVDRQEVLSRLPRAQVDVVPNGVEFPAQLPPGDPQPNTLIYTGLIGWRPNEDAVLYFAREIYPLVKEQVREVSWSVVGKGPRPAVQALAQVDPSITVTGAVPEITPYVQGAAVVIVPLRVGSGTRLKILEAMAMGKAIVSTAVGAEGLDVTDGENIMIADTPAEFADALVRLLTDPAECRRLGENGRLLVAERYSWDIIGQEITRLVKALSG